jgi:hypothetical protein
MGFRILGALLGDDKAADPVPVRRPGVCVTGVEVCDCTGISTASHTGRTNIGLNLEDIDISDVIADTNCRHTEKLAIESLPTKPNWTR